MENRNYYKEVAIGAGAAAGISALIGIAERLIMYYATPGNCTETKEWIKEITTPTKDKLIVWK